MDFEVKDYLGKAKLIICNGDSKREVSLGVENTVGRIPQNLIQIPDRLVSKEHCLIFYDPRRGYVLKDVGSSNGTYVNGQRIQTEVVLKDGDAIGLGTTRCIFVREKSATSSTQIDEKCGTIPVSNIRSKIVPKEDRFLPEQEIQDEKTLRTDYEKLRITHELQRSIGLELDLDRLFTRILDHTFQFLDCDRAMILIADETGDLKLRALKTRRKEEKLIISSTLIRQVQAEKVGIISADALSDDRFDGAESILLQMIRSSMAVPILHEGDLLGVMLIDSSVSVNAYCEKDLLLLSNIANQTAQFIKNVELAKRIESEAITRERFQRLLSPDLAELVVSGALKVEKGGENRFATVLFADIRGFTSMSENMSASGVLQMLNEYFELMVEIVFSYEGTVDKFVGDNIMVIWGTPISHTDDPVRAVRAALTMQYALEEFNKARESAGEQAIRIGIGINSGELVAGYIGSSRTMSYSVIGDAVNVASRLCSAAKPGQILISEDTFRLLDNQFEVKDLPPLHAKGKSKPLKVYNVLSELPENTARFFRMQGRMDTGTGTR